MKSLKIFLFNLFILFVLFGSVSSASAYTVTFNKTGTGTGIIKNTNGSLNCGTICSKDYLAGTGDGFNDYPDYGSVFKGWSGDMTGGSFFSIVSGTHNYDITATFDKGGVPIISTLTDVSNPIYGSSIAISAPGSFANGYPFVEKGLVWGTSSGPTVALSTKTVRGVISNYYGSLNGYSDGITGLSPNTTYYVRAYAKNDFGVGYSNEIIVKTGQPDIVVGDFLCKDANGNNTCTSTNKNGVGSFSVRIKNDGINNTPNTSIESRIEYASKPDGAGTRYTDYGPVNPTSGNPLLYKTGYEYVNSGTSNWSGFKPIGARHDTVSFKVCTDISGKVDESDESNNCSPWQNVYIKLAPGVSITASPSSGAPGMTSSIKWNVYNDPESCVATGDWSGSKAFSGTETVGPLNEARVYNYTLICSNPDGDSDPGTATVTITAPIVKLPDLIISSGVVPTSALVNTATTYSAIVKNKGEGTTGASFVNLFQTATDITNLMSPVGLKDYATTSMDTLEAGATANTSKSITFSSVGTYYVRACADKSSAGDTGKIKESDEDRNCSEWTPVTVSADAFIDLVVSNVTPKSAIINKSTTFSADVKNLGNTSTGKDFKNFFQIATGPNGTGGIIDKTATTMEKLFAGGTKTATVNHTFTANGTYYVRACADKSSSVDTGVIDESNEDNNCSGVWEAVIVDDGSKCNDEDAANYKLPGKCFYGSNLCIDPTSKNYGSPLPCDASGNAEGTCFDKIKNNNEVDIDCGGRCPKCGGIKYIEI